MCADRSMDTPVSLTQRRAANHCDIKSERKEIFFAISRGHFRSRIVTIYRQRADLLHELGPTHCINMHWLAQSIGLNKPQRELLASEHWCLPPRKTWQTRSTDFRVNQVTQSEITLRFTNPSTPRMRDEDSEVSAVTQDVTIIHNLDFRVFFPYAVSLLMYT